MRQKRLYQWTIAGLLLLNLCWVVNWGYRASGPRSAMQHHKVAKKALQLDDAQFDAFVASANDHHHRLSKLRDQEREHLQRYFEHLIRDTTTLPDEALLEAIEGIQRQKIQETYQHFATIKKILTPAQDAAFETFMRHVLKHVILPTRKKGPPQKEK